MADRVTILGQKLMEQWGMDEYELLQEIKKGLKAQGSFNTQVEIARLLHVEDTPADLSLVRTLQFDLEMVQKFERENFDNDTSDILRCPDGTKWEDIKITLIDDETVRIKTPNGERRFTYHTLDMVDKRKGNQPTMLWALLKIFAEHQGHISRDNPHYDPKLPETAKRLNKHLQRLFGIKDSIYRGHYKAEKGYRTKIFFSSSLVK